MKTIGLIGGMSWESTTSYYQLINETIKNELGGLHSAKILLYSVDFAEIEHYQASGDWAKSAEVLSKIAQKLEQAGADFVVICTNTMHKVAPQIQEKITIPILHIAQATAESLLENGIQKVGLLGTKYTMTQDFYKDKLLEAGLEVLIPDQAGIAEVNRIIYDELCLGDIKDNSKQTYLAIIDDLKNAGAQSVILGCTEIGLLVKQADTDLPLYDTTAIHAEKAAQLAVNE
ncbi:TPA: aspartate/glutamate racemase family protein [Streptococcus suis]|nr:aspartate/glutamate racemase family protein [Streptococcus suis]